MDIVTIRVKGSVKGMVNITIRGTVRGMVSVRERIKWIENK